jgi:hypothetical protein
MDSESNDVKSDDDDGVLTLENENPEEVKKETLKMEESSNVNELISKKKPKKKKKRNIENENSFRIEGLLTSLIGESEVVSVAKKKKKKKKKGVGVEEKKRKKNDEDLGEKFVY